NLPNNFIDHLRRSLTGRPSPILSNLCAGLDFGVNIARGYITIDTVNNCTLRLPTDPGYFATDITDENVLWGDYYYVNPNDNSALGETLVHIVADPADPGLSTPGSYTFYGRHVAWTAMDHRQPLVTNFAVGYDINNAFTGTDLIVWRDSKVSQGPFTCPALTGRPSWFPLGQESIVIFDEEENPDILAGFSPFPAEAQSTVVGGPDLPVPFDSGWMFLNLNTAVPAAGPNPPEDPDAAQAWVTVVKRLSTSQYQFAVGFDALLLDSACRANHSILPPL
ncbi:MAG TPA: hypothetical protein VG477_13225, partial [Thermoanaerobaculia bacterium]|nr:hypothetical protein [Thermoanaerobaculia bacterium]